MTSEDEYRDAAQPLKKGIPKERHVTVGLPRRTAGPDDTQMVNRIAKELVERDLIDYDQPEGMGVKGVIRVVAPADYSPWSDKEVERRGAVAVTAARWKMMVDVDTKREAYKKILDDQHSTLEEKVGARKVIDIFDGLLEGWGFTRSTFVIEDSVAELLTLDWGCFAYTGTAVLEAPASLVSIDETA